MPHPEILAGYERVAPGSAQKIFNVFEKQAAHRMELERAVVLGEVRRSQLGLILGAIVALALIGCGTYLSANGMPVAGLSLIAAELVGIVGAFAYGTWSRRKERETKARMLGEAKGAGDEE